MLATVHCQTRDSKCGLEDPNARCDDRGYRTFSASVSRNHVHQRAAGAVTSTVLWYELYCRSHVRVLLSPAHTGLRLPTWRSARSHRTSSTPNRSTVPELPAPRYAQFFFYRGVRAAFSRTDEPAAASSASRHLEEFIRLISGQRKHTVPSAHPGSIGPDISAGRAAQCLPRSWTRRYS